ncbi:helix-turn-helix domain-containing protein [Streptomyces sp. NPDC089919]|uniref:helix-turn-helix domain-containing protein n=1 Tax=Streptomyces sp. NPDC089919 TaxID=3155188 RepID=UPI00342B5148
MTTAHQQIIPSQTGVTASRASRPRPGDLPDPDERRRLRERWGLSTRQVAAAFGVTPATVRSWERGRSTPRGSRKEAYRRLLAGLAQHSHVAMSRAAEHDRLATAEARSRPARRPAAAPVPVVRHSTMPGPTCPTPPAEGSVPYVATGRKEDDPVAAERIRRLRLLGAAACVWSLALWLILTCPPSI